MIKSIKYLFLLLCSFCLLSTSFSNAQNEVFTIPINVDFGNKTTKFQSNSANNVVVYRFPYNVKYSDTFLNNSTVSSFTKPELCIYLDSNYFLLSGVKLNLQIRSYFYSLNTIGYSYFDLGKSSITEFSGYCWTANLYKSNGYIYPNLTGNVNDIVIALAPNSSWTFPYQFTEDTYLSGFITINGKDLLDISEFGSSSTPDCSQDSNYLQCLESLNSANGVIGTLSGSLASCQSDLSSCQGGLDAAYLQCLEDKETCQTSYNTLSGQYLSCVNYSSSLSDQLAECLENSSGSGEELLCNTYSLSWYDGNDIFSSQIRNDIRLPRGYRGYLSEGVLGVKSLYSPENAYSLSSEEFDSVLNSYGILFLFLFSGGLFVLFLYVIRKYFTSLFK